MTHRRRTDSPATDFAVALLAEFARVGVRDAVLSPGSRSQALALAAAALAARDILTLHVRIDERVAGFTALGLAVESGSPVLMITTSGTAVANLHPAVLEAHHSGVPVVVLTADRPAELRGIGSNQTTQQAGIFGPVLQTTDVPAPTGDPEEEELARSLARNAAAAAGPVHLNLAFREPLSAAVELTANAGAWSAPPAGTPLRAPVELPVDDATVVIAGAGAGAAAEDAARELGTPLLAEVSSGARFGPHLVGAYRELLNDDRFGGRVRRAVVFGHPTLSREVPALLQRGDVEAIVVRGPGAELYNPGHRMSAFVDAVTATGSADWRPWVGSWVTASRALLERPSTAPGLETSRAATPAAQSAYAKAILADAKAPIDRRMLVEAVWAATWPHDRLVLAASRLIREADRVVPGKRIRVHANRGLAGIDGTISTATGVALAAARTPAGRGVTRVLLGDLAFLHDVGGLLSAPGEVQPPMQLIVGNDRGGTIFDGLEVAASADPEAFDRVLLTPQQVALEPLAAAYGWDYRRVATRSELEQALTGGGAHTIIEVPLPR
ncbi:2-succinyl-5-enolpyruvyl-6-hydroxy-3-cyclohexene-1-carboxylic-acid synthase [Lysobacter korlensis]|uniref:2-succinyl-5-enolpyruvyl-6-hydroxy-3-cyclohexene-1-carboxylate synthase n=1 Tax=Lysobacter korlensis TaxID=553636 RepID=A0ABV6RTT2_9GAMM